MSDFLVSMAFTAVNELTPVLAEINAQLDGLRANMATLGTASKASIDTTAVEAMAPAMSSAATEAKNLEKGLGAAGVAAAATSKKVVSAKKGFTALGHLGTGLTVGGGILGFGVVEAVKVAGELQSKLVTIQDTTGATTKQLNGLSDAIMNVSANVSRFSDLEVAGFAQQLASGGLGSVKNVQSLLMPMTQFADAQMYEGKVSDGSDAVNMAINMAHLLGHYDPKSLLKSLNTFNQYSNMEPGSSDDLFQTLKYLAPTALRSLHMDETSVMQMAALANRVGLTGSHGGTNAADMVLRLIPGYVMGMGGNPSKTAMSAMEQLGMVNAKGQSQFFKNGQIVDFQKLVQTLIQDGKKFNPEELTKLYTHVFGIQGGRAATIFSDPKVLQQLQGMVQQLKHTKSIEQIQRDQQNTPAGQMNQMKSNLQTADIRFAKQLGAALNPLLHTVNALLIKFLDFEKQNPKLLKFAGVFMAISAAVLLTVGPMLLAVAGIGKFVGFIRGPELRAGIGIFGKLGGGILKLGPIFGRVTGWTYIWRGLNATMGLTGKLLTGMGSSMLRFGAWIVRLTRLDKAWAIAQGLVNTAFEVNPVALIIAGIVVAVALLIAGIVELIIHWKQVINWIRSVVTWFRNLHGWVQIVIDVFVPFIGLPLTILAHWKPIAAFFINLWNNVFKPLINGIGKFGGGVFKDIEHLFGGGSGASNTPVVSARVGQPGPQITNHFYIQSTDPKGAADEVSKVNDKYYNSRLPKPAY